MDAITGWATSWVAGNPKIASILMVVLAIDQVLKLVKNALKLDIPDNVFDFIGDFLGKILGKNTPPKV